MTDDQALFRVAIAILKMNETGITSCESVSDLFTFMSNMTSRLWTADKLIAVCVSLLSVGMVADTIVATCLQAYYQAC